MCLKMPQVLAKHRTAMPNTSMELGRQQLKTSIHYLYILNLYKGNKRFEKIISFLLLYRAF